MARKGKMRFWLRWLGALVLIYGILWSVGFYRSWSFVSELRREHDQRGKEIERFVSKLKIGHDADLVRKFRYSAKGKDESEWVIWYYDLVDEDSSVSNRAGPVYKIRIGTGEVTSIEKSLSMSHGDKFGNPLLYYPRVALFGFSTDERG